MCLGKQKQGIIFPEKDLVSMLLMLTVRIEELFFFVYTPPSPWRMIG